MSCERFKTRLMDFALGAEDPELGAHLNACANCRAALDAQRTLLDSIDRGLASMVAESPSGDFAAHVRHRIAQESVTTRPWFAGWLPVSAAALTIVVLVGVLTIGRSPRPPQSVEVTPPVHVAPIQKAGAIAVSEVAPTELPRTVAISRPSRTPQPAANREPEVLVPRGEMDAVMRLFSSNWNGKADGATLMAAVAPTAELLRPLNTLGLNISPLQIELLEEEGKSKGSSEIR